MSRAKLITVLAAVGVVGGLAACGNPVAANRNFRTVAKVTLTKGVDAAGVTFTHVNYQGTLVDGRKRAIPRTYFNENCYSKPGQPIVCAAVVGTGARLYVFSGQVAEQPDMTLRSSAADSPRATLTIRVQQNPKPAPETALMDLFVRTGS